MILIAIFCLLAVGYITYKTVRHIAHPDLKLDNPPAGYEQLTGEQFEELIADFKEAEPDTALDAFYVGGDGYRQIFIAHQNTKNVVIFRFGESGLPPDTKDSGEMASFVMENRIEIEEGLRDTYENVGAKSESISIISIDSFQLENDGSCGIHTTARIQRSDDTLVQDYLLIYRNDIAYGATAQNQLGESNSDEVEYLLQNLYFE